MTKIPKRFLRDPGHCLALGFGSGLAPKAPGTFGTLAGLLVFLLLPELALPGYLLVVVISFVLGVWLCERCSRALGVHDHGGIVWDEFVGLWIALIAVPSGWVWLVLGFVLFRLFDIWKPQPIRWLDQRVQGGLGIMLDDVVAGLYALACVQAVAWFLGQ